jgi:hypothetical protein
MRRGFLVIAINKGIRKGQKRQVMQPPIAPSIVTDSLCRNSFSVNMMAIADIDKYITVTMLKRSMKISSVAFWKPALPKHSVHSTLLSSREQGFDGKTRSGGASRFSEE